LKTRVLHRGRTGALTAAAATPPPSPPPPSSSPPPQQDARDNEREEITRQWEKIRTVRQDFSEQRAAWEATLEQQAEERDALVAETRRLEGGLEVEYQRYNTESEKTRELRKHVATQKEEITRLEEQQHPLHYPPRLTPKLRPPLPLPR